jgi:hypothetical protein
VRRLLLFVEVVELLPLLEPDELLPPEPLRRLPPEPRLLPLLRLDPELLDELPLEREPLDEPPLRPEPLEPELRECCARTSIAGNAISPMPTHNDKTRPIVFLVGKSLCMVSSPCARRFNATRLEQGNTVTKTAADCTTW